MLIEIPDATKRQTAIQLIRSGSQWVASYFVSLVVVAAAVDALGVDPETIEGAVRTVIEVLTFIVYIGAVRLLETRVHPLFGWLNGWATTPVYPNGAGDIIEVTGHPKS